MVPPDRAARSVATLVSARSFRRAPASTFAPVGGPDGRYAGVLVVSRTGQVRTQPYVNARGRVAGRVLEWLEHRRGPPRVRLPAFVIEGVRLPVRTVLVAELVHDAWHEPGSFDPDGPAPVLVYANGKMDDVRADNLSRGDERALWRALPIPGYSRYRVSAAGIVATTDNARRSLRPMRPRSLPGTGHLVVGLTRDAPRGGATPAVQVSRELRVDALVAGAWCERPGGVGLEALGIQHVGDDPARCSADALRFVDDASAAQLVPLPALPRGVRFRRPRTPHPWVNEHVLVATDGRVWLMRHVRPALPRRPGEPGTLLGGHWVAPSVNRNGHEVVAINIPSSPERYQRAVHVLVGEARDGPSDDRSIEYRHIDGNRRNNHENNLARGPVRRPKR